MKKFSLFLITALFCLAIFAAPLLFFLLPGRDFSEREKRYLAEKPSLSLSSLADGSFTEKLGTYVADHFPGRELFVGINAYYDLYSGRQATKDYFPAEGRLFARPVEKNMDTLEKNLGFVNGFCRSLREAETELPVSLMLVPSSGAVLLEEPAYPDEELIAYARAHSEASFVDLLPVFRAAPDPGRLYYRTDHHWTSAGAFEAACAYRRSLDQPCLEQSDYRFQRFGPFYGSAYSASGLWNTDPDEVELWYSGRLLHADNEAGGANDSVFYLDRLQEQDLYTVYLDGNHSLVRIENLSGGLGQRRHLLVIRDSFSNSLGCFLADLYDKVILVDLRYYKLPLTDLLIDEDIDEVLVEYSVDNFVNDTNLAFLSVDGEALHRHVEEQRRPPNYFAPPPLTEEVFENTVYLGDSVIAALANHCTKYGGLEDTFISSNAMLSYHETVRLGRKHLIYKGRYATLPELLEDRQPAILISALGCNDLATYDLDRCIESVPQFLEIVRQVDPNIRIFLQSVMPVRLSMPDFGQEKVDQFNAWLKEHAEEYDYCYLALDEYFKAEDGQLSYSYYDNPTHISIGGGRIWYEQFLNIDNYHNFPKSMYVEYDGATGLPLPNAAAPAQEAETPPDETREESELDAVYAELCRQLSVPEMLEVSARVDSVLGIGPEEYEAGRFYFCANGLKADEIWLVKLADEAAVQAMLDKARERIEVKANSLDKYLPAESELTRRGITAAAGNYVALFISPDAEQMQRIFLETLG